jgi:hypothetical protein
MIGANQEMELVLFLAWTDVVAVVGFADVVVPAVGFCSNAMIVIFRLSVKNYWLN